MIPQSGQNEFIEAELITGFTLARIARDAKYEDKRERNRVNSRKAYDAILRFLPALTITDEQRLKIESRLAKLKFELQQLGEVF